MLPATIFLALHTTGYQTWYKIETVILTQEEQLLTKATVPLPSPDHRLQ